MSTTTTTKPKPKTCIRCREPHDRSSPFCSDGCRVAVWRAVNVLKVRGYREAWVAKNPDRDRASHRAWRVKNWKHVLALDRARKDHIRDELRARDRARYAEKKGSPVKVTRPRLPPGTPTTGRQRRRKK